jgi:hypothetical protein
MDGFVLALPLAVMAGAAKLSLRRTDGAEA